MSMMEEETVFPFLQLHGDLVSQIFSRITIFLPEDVPGTRSLTPDLRDPIAALLSASPAAAALTLRSLTSTTIPLILETAKVNLNVQDQGPSVVLGPIATRAQWLLARRPALLPPGSPPAGAAATLEAPAAWSLTAALSQVLAVARLAKGGDVASLGGILRRLSGGIGEKAGEDRARNGATKGSLLSARIVGREEAKEASAADRESAWGGVELRSLALCGGGALGQVPGGRPLGGVTSIDFELFAYDLPFQPPTSYLTLYTGLQRLSLSLTSDAEGRPPALPTGWLSALSSLHSLHTLSIKNLEAELDISGLAALASLRELTLITEGPVVGDPTAAAPASPPPLPCLTQLEVRMGSDDFASLSFLPTLNALNALTLFFCRSDTAAPAAPNPDPAPFHAALFPSTLRRLYLECEEVAQKPQVVQELAQRAPGLTYLMFRYHPPAPGDPSRDRIVLPPAYSFAPYTCLKELVLRIHADRHVEPPPGGIQLPASLRRLKTCIRPIPHRGALLRWLPDSIPPNLRVLYLSGVEVDAGPEPLASGGLCRNPNAPRDLGCGCATLPLAVAQRIPSLRSLSFKGRILPSDRSMCAEIAAWRAGLKGQAGQAPARLRELGLFRRQHGPSIIGGADLEARDLAPEEFLGAVDSCGAAGLELRVLVDPSRQKDPFFTGAVM